MKKILLTFPDRTPHSNMMLESAEKRNLRRKLSDYPYFHNGIEQANYHLGVTATPISYLDSGMNTWAWEAENGKVLTWGRISPNWDANLRKFIDPA